LGDAYLWFNYRARSVVGSFTVSAVQIKRLPSPQRFTLVSSSREKNSSREMSESDQLIVLRDREQEVPQY